LFEDEELRAEFEERLRACVRDKRQRMCIDVVREMVYKWLDEMVGGDELRKECRLGQKVGHATVCGWLKQFGCVYTLKGKTFYVDGHEREEVVQSRHEFLAEFNKVQEAAPVWISLVWDKLDVPTQKHLIEHQLIHLHWQSCAGKAMVKVHVDSLGMGNEYIVFNAVWSAYWPFGGGFSDCMKYLWRLFMGRMRCLMRRVRLLRRCPPSSWWSGW
jgi:hypothetical protein